MKLLFPILAFTFCTAVVTLQVARAGTEASQVPVKKLDLNPRKKSDSKELEIPDFSKVTTGQVDGQVAVQPHECTPTINGLPQQSGSGQSMYQPFDPTAKVPCASVSASTKGK